MFLIASGGIVYADAPYHIGIVTGTVSQGEDELRGAEKLIEDYGDASSGGMIAHVTYPDNFMQEMETVISQIVGLADDPLMKAIVVNQSIPGTTEAFRRVKEKRPDILCFAAEAQEDPGVISSTADLVTSVNDVYRGYLIPVAAKMMGATDFVHISFPRHMSYELLSRRRNIMEAVCKDIGVNFHFETAPDPVSDVGVAGAQQFILEKVPAWLDKYGPKTAFFNTNVAHVEPLIRQIVAYGGYYVESSVPSPLRGYPGALGLDLTAEKGNFPAIMKKIEEVIIQKGASGRLGTWAYSCGYAESAGLVELARRIIDGEAEMTIEDLVDAYEKYTPGSEWNGSYYVDLSTGIEKTNYILVYQDTYVFGRGYLGLTKLEVPEKYLTIR
ncbi:MAG: DUF3798 domain-containing protein [Acetomicrobium sp.]|uniref:DUF3798 domain-containing protein n=1 Tax=Acetomicrobium TaxID=49894 RepID=UPI0026ECD72C|nr:MULTISPECIES: DUF3798 domain-containing protein [Acetomicrobium]MDI9377525.1 DUF3798 domain-containing protein [Synergistota bacterium]MDR9769031.1 DUF3798 domain-containing protein [Acetomicrobium sp.]HOB10975.1 DUF3798 domain-containing protein [Acetomicrobium sp.]HQA37236.1 DUF3798 domain-containing protein [Acetomicrobium sp.]HQC88036.1 DUF3798 domain-containing protein [Acetomicrobium sp.]